MAMISSVLAFAIPVLSACAPASQTPDAGQLLTKAIEVADSGDSKRAVELLNQALELDPKMADAYYVRGREHFRLGMIPASVEDFDRFVRLRPDRESRQWERGIALYYAGEFEKGAKQFELYQTFENNDVENAVWRYLCMCPTVGVEKARQTLLPIENDRRVPMMQVYRMFRGESTPADVVAAASEGKPPAAERQRRTFYADLYLGLYYESIGEKELARKHIVASSADEYRRHRGINRYMWDVARIHADRLNPKDGDGAPGVRP